MRKEILEEIEFDGDIDNPILFGENGTGRTKRVQEWICLHKYHTPGWNISLECDDWFGGATEKAVLKFQEVNGLEASGEVCEKTWRALVRPMIRATRELAFSDSVKLSERFIRYMEMFLLEHPTELRSNLGPWVRFFMKGHDGDWAAWCNGSVSTAVEFACENMGIDMNEIIPWTWSCPKARKYAKSGDYTCSYIDSEKVSTNTDLAERGDIFLVMEGTRAKHIGAIVKNDNGLITTIEGNTNDEGSYNGYEMCSRYRDLSSGKYSIIKLNR